MRNGIPDEAIWWGYTVVVLGREGTDTDVPPFGFQVVEAYYDENEQCVGMQVPILAGYSTQEVMARVEWLAQCVREAVANIDDPNIPKPWDYEGFSGADGLDNGFAVRISHRQKRYKEGPK